VVAQVARAVNDGVCDGERHTLWPLIVALDTARPRHPVLSLRLSWYAGKASVRATREGDLRQAWGAVLDEHARLYGHQPSSVPTQRLSSLSAHQTARWGPSPLSRASHACPLCRCEYGSGPFGRATGPQGVGGATLRARAAGARRAGADALPGGPGLRPARAVRNRLAAYPVPPCVRHSASSWACFCCLPSA